MTQAMSTELAQSLIAKHGAANVGRALKLEAYRRHFPYFAEELLKLAPKDPTISSTGLIPFKLNRAQKHLDEITSAQLQRDGWIRLCVLKARQIGGSTWGAGRAYQLTALTPHTHAMIFAHDDKTSEEILKMVKRFHDHTPEEFKPRLHSRPQGEIIFMDPSSPPGFKDRRIGSSIACQTARSAFGGTGHTLQFVHLSECSKYDYPHTLWTSLTPAIPDAPRTSVVLESTAHHSGIWFREQCERAKNDPDNPFQFFFAPWYYADEYAMPLKPGEKLKLSLEEKQWVKEHDLTHEQIKWYRYKLNWFGGDDMAAEMMRQEYPFTDEEAWIDLSASVFDRRKLYGYLKEEVRSPHRVCDIVPDGSAPGRLLDNPQGRLHVWADPEPGEQYDIGADVSSGLEGDDHDSSVASVVHRNSRTQVAEWRGQIGEIDYAQVLSNLGHYYNRAQIAVETTGLGFAVNEQLHKLRYPNLYIWRTRGEAVPQLTRYSGWRTSNESKGYLVSVVRHHITNEQLHIRSHTLWHEMCVFAQHATNSGNYIGYSAQSGEHDDAVMAFMIAIIIGDDERAGYSSYRPKDPYADIDWSFDPRLIDNYDVARHNQIDPLDALEYALLGG